MKLSCNTRRSLSISFEWLYLFSDTSTSMPQWGCVRAVWFILLTMVITRPMKLEKVPVNSKITASWWTNISPKQYSCILNLTNMKNEELLDSKRDCVSWLSSHFFTTANYTSLYDSPWNLRKRMTKSQHQVKQNLSPKLEWYQTLQTTKTGLWQNVGLTKFSSSSLSIRACFVFAVVRKHTTVVKIQ